MDAIKGTYKQGQIVLDRPVAWPEGYRVVVAPEGASGLSLQGDDEFEDSPEAIQRWITAFQAIPPWEFTPQEEAEWHAARRAVKEYTIAKMRQQFAEGQP